MIKYLTQEDRFAPVLLCDICNTRIDDAEAAAAVHNLDAPEGKPSEILYTHKGECHSLAETQIQAAGGYPGWTELTRHMYLLTQNLGLTPTRLQKEAELQDEFRL